MVTNDTPLQTDDEIIEWVKMLAPKNSRRIDIIYDLLFHAGRLKKRPGRQEHDPMTDEDAKACWRAIELVKAGRVPEAGGAITLPDSWAETAIEM